MMNLLHALLLQLKNCAFKPAVIIASIGLVFGPAFVAYAQDQSDSIQEKIDALEQEIKTYQKELIGIQQQGLSLSNSLREINTSQKALDTTIKKTGKQIERTDASIKSLSNQILSHEEQIQVGKLAMSKNLRDLYEYQDTTLFELLLTDRPLSDKWRDIDQLGKIQQSIGEQIGVLEYNKTQLAHKIEESEKNKEELSSLVEQKQQEKNSLTVVQNEKAKLLKETQNKESEYQKIIADKLAKKKQFEQELFDYESKLHYTFKPGQIPAAGSHPLAWPTREPYITQFFGATPSSTKLYASGQHSGVDFRAAVGTPILATAPGVVAGVGDTDTTCPRASFGKWIFIKHDNGLAVVYAHLSQINVKKGTKVTTGQVIGLSGNTGHSTAPHLHISVFPADAVDIQDRPSQACPGKVFTMPIAATDAYLNPILYLPAYTKDMVKPGAGA